MLTGEPMRRVHAIALFAMLAAAAACNNVDTKDAEKKVKQIAEENIGPVKSVSCPSAKRKKGVKFTCKVNFQNGGVGTMEIELMDDDGNFQPNWVPWIVDGEKLATTVSTGLQDQQPDLGAPTVDCGKGIIEVPAEGVACHVKAGAIENDLMVKSSKDGIEWEVKKP